MGVTTLHRVQRKTKHPEVFHKLRFRQIGINFIEENPPLSQIYIAFRVARHIHPTQKIKMLSILLISSDLTGKNSRESLIGGGLKLEASGTQTATVILRAEPTHYLPESSLRHGLSHYKKKQQNLRTLSIQTFQRLFPLCFRMGPLQLWQIPSLSKLPITSVTHHVVICNGSKSFL